MARPPTQRSCLLVAPHPDDETAGAGIWMRRFGPERLTVLHLTDGSPRKLSFAREAGFCSRREYRLAREMELRHALNCIGIRSHQRVQFHFLDQEVYRHLPRLIARLKALVERLRPDLVLSPAYEGGHPDHDAAAFAVAMVRERATLPFEHYEYSLYHAGPDGRMITGAFLPSENPVSRITFSASEMAHKRRMLDCFRSQQAILSKFSLARELVRPAPRYDFSKPPHQGPLLYEQWWHLSSGLWRECARRLN
jgi:LmbE family N-acetylglucosaminyl deacetylase